MEAVTFHYHRNRGVFSKLIEWRTGSNISHVSIEIRGWHYNAYLQRRFYKTREIGKYVVDSESFMVSSFNADEICKLLENSLGDLYDVKSILGFFLNKPKQSRGRWFCSELANAILEYAIPGEVHHPRLLTPESIRIALRYFNLGIYVGKTQ